MKTGFIVCAVLAVCLGTAALSTGSPFLLIPALLIFLVLTFSVLSVRLVVRTLSVHSSLSSGRVCRGEPVTLGVDVEVRGLLPVAPITLELISTHDAEPMPIRLRSVNRRVQRLTMPFQASHIGPSYPGVRSMTVEDIFGLYRKTINAERSLGELLVLPGTFRIEELRFAPGDPGSEVMSRATEDISSPSDFRLYQTGDSMKKIHWKLSAKKQEWMVRRFDEPILSDALILMDGSPPPSWGHPEAEADIRDALLETAASVLTHLLRSDHPFRLPLMGQHPVDLERGTGEALLLENLARADFSETDRFERVLLFESRRMRKVGSTVVISARLNGPIVDMMIRLHRMGPCLRFYLITFVPDDPALKLPIERLQQAGIEIHFVKPVPI